MPQVDLETLVSACAGGSCDRKIACETLAATATVTASTVDQHQQPRDSNADPPEEVPPDFPPESFWLSKDAELDWFDRNAFYERKDSTKGANSTNLNPNGNPSSTTSNTSNSQRFSNLKAKASIIGLPKPQKFIDPQNRRTCKIENIRLFPKRSGSNPKSDSSLAEPSSPKVSCMGRVRSKRDRSRRLKSRQRSRRSTEPDRKRNDKAERKEKNGFFSSFKAIFGHGRKHTNTTTKTKTKTDQNGSSAHNESSSRRKRSAATHDIRDRLPAGERDAQPRRSVGLDDPAAAAEPVGLGGMKRFASGRRSESWGGVGGDVA